MAKTARRLALVAIAGEPKGTGSPCSDCGVARTALNTSICWSDTAKTRLTFHYAVCDACRSARMCKRLRDDPVAKLVQMGADASARTKRPCYGGKALSAQECTDLIARLMHAQEGCCASCKHEVTLAAGGGIFMASLDKVGVRYDDGMAQILCFGCQRFFNSLGATERADLVRAVVDASAMPRPPPLAALPVEFERTIESKVRQMKVREGSADRPSRGSLVKLEIAAARDLLLQSALRCT